MPSIVGWSLHKYQAAGVVPATEARLGGGLCRPISRSVRPGLHRPAARAGRSRTLQSGGDGLVRRHCPTRVHGCVPGVLPQLRPRGAHSVLDEGAIAQRHQAATDLLAQALCRGEEAGRLLPPTTAPTAAPTDVATAAPSSTPVVPISPTVAPTVAPEQTAAPVATASPQPTSAVVTIHGAHFTLSVETSTLAPGQPITLTATLSSLSSQSTTPRTVTFHDGETVLGTAFLVNGTATLTTTALGSGVHNLTVTLDGQQAGTNATTPPVVVVAQQAGMTIPLLVLHNRARTVRGGRTAACTLAGNTNGSIERGCEIVSSQRLPGAMVTYTVRYADGATQTFTDTADRRGHSLHAFNAAALPAAVSHGLARAVVLIAVMAVLPDGTTAGTTRTRYAVQR
jgi:hypothetical protein